MNTSPLLTEQFFNDKPVGIEVLAFIYLVKSRHCSSVLYNPSYRGVARTLGLPLKTTTRIIKTCLTLGYARIEHNHLIFISCDEILRRNGYRNSKLFNLKISKATTFKEIKNILFSHYIIFSQQKKEFIYNLKKIVQGNTFEPNSRRVLKKLIRLGYSPTPESTDSHIVNTYIELSRKLKVSKTTIGKMVHQCLDSLLLTRKIITERIKMTPKQYKSFLNFCPVYSYYCGYAAILVYGTQYNTGSKCM